MPKKGNYQDLASFKKATVIYDLTFYFAKRFLLKGDRTIDQMVQAARSGKQNIAEGCAAAATSAETELKLINVARAKMTAARLGYRGDQKNCIAELEAENAALRARIAELEQKLKELMRPMSLMGLIGHIGLMGLMSLIGMIALTSCGGDSTLMAPLTEAEEPPTEVGTVISFSAQEGIEQEMSQGARGYTRAGTPLSAIATQFTVWGHKNMRYEAGAYSDMQTVFPGYTVTWQDNSAATTTTNSNGWEYVQATPTVQTVKYWDWSAAAYRFFAVTGYTAHEPNGAYGPAGAYKAHEISIAADASSTAAMDDTPYFSRLWFSTGDPVAYADKQFGRPVTLEFVKPLARVRYIFKYTYPREGIELAEQAFKPTADTRIARKGTVTVIYPLDGTEIKEWYETTPDAGGTGALEALEEDYDPEDDRKTYTVSDNGWYVVLPNPTQGSYTLSVKVNGETKRATVPAEYMHWQPGYSYTYVFKITDEGGVEIGWVESAVTPWTEMFADRTVYNW